MRKKVGTILGSIRKHFATRKDLKSENLEERHPTNKTFTKSKRWKSTNHNQREVKVPLMVHFHEGNAPQREKDTKSTILNGMDRRRDFCVHDSASQNVLGGRLKTEREDVNSELPQGEVCEDSDYAVIPPICVNDDDINIEVNGCSLVYQLQKPCSDVFNNMNETSLHLIASNEQDNIHEEDNGCSSVNEFEQSRNETFEDKDENIPKGIHSSAETENYYSSLCLPEVGQGHEYDYIVSRSSSFRQINVLSPTLDDEMEHQMSLLEHEESSISISENKNRVARSRSQSERTLWSYSPPQQMTPLASLSRNIGRRRNVCSSPSLKKRKTFSGRRTKAIKQCSSSVSAFQSGCRNRDSCNDDNWRHCDDLRERKCSSRKKEAKVMFVADDPCVCHLIYNTRQLFTRKAIQRKHIKRHFKDKGQSSMIEICGEDDAFFSFPANPDDPRIQEFHGMTQEMPRWEEGTICAAFMSLHQELEDENNFYDDCETSCRTKESCEDDIHDRNTSDKTDEQCKMDNYEMG